MYVWSKTYYFAITILECSILESDLGFLLHGNQLSDQSLINFLLIIAQHSFLRLVFPHLVFYETCLFLSYEYCSHNISFCLMIVFIIYNNEKEFKWKRILFSYSWEVKILFGYMYNFVFTFSIFWTYLFHPQQN